MPRVCPIKHDEKQGPRVRAGRYLSAINHAYLQRRKAADVVGDPAPRDAADLALSDPRVSALPCTT
jgi:hypothetical protein